MQNCGLIFLFLFVLWVEKMCLMWLEDRMGINKELIQGFARIEKEYDEYLAAEEMKN
jgi:hypothetical protein